MSFLLITTDLCAHEKTTSEGEHPPENASSSVSRVVHDEHFLAWILYLDEEVGDHAQPYHVTSH